MSRVTLFTVKYGADRRYDLELFGSVMSARCLSPDVQIRVLTDRPIPDFDDLVQVTLLGPKEFLEWTRGGPHLIKMYAIERVLNESDGPAIYFDTDIVFKQPPTELLNRISSGESVMNAYEGTLGREHVYWKPTIAKLASSPFDNSIDNTTAMYNSGIVGLLPEHAHLMRRALQMALTCYSVDPNTPFNAEQLYTGKVLSSQTRLNTCEDVVDHYWGWRRGLVHLKLEALNERWRQKSISEDELLLEFQSMLRPDIDARDRVRARLRRMAYRQDENTGFAYLCYLSAIRAGNGSPRLARRWLDVCLDMIFRSQDARGSLKLEPNSVSFLARLNHSRASWLSEDQQQKAEQFLRHAA